MTNLRSFALMALTLGLLTTPALAQAPFLRDIPSLQGSGSNENWSWFDITEPVTGSTTSIAFNRAAENPVEGVQGTFSAQCLDDQYWLWMILFGTEVTSDLGNNLLIRFRFDGGAALELPASPANGGGAAIISESSGRRDLLGRVLAGQQLSLEVTTEAGELLAYRFELAGARQALATLGCLAGDLDGTHD